MEWRCRFLALTMVHDTCLNYVDRTANQSHTCITIRQMRCDGLKFGGCIGSAESNCRCICLRPAARPCKARSTTVHNHHRSKSTPTPTEKKACSMVSETMFLLTFQDCIEVRSAPRPSRDIRTVTLSIGKERSQGLRKLREEPLRSLNRAASLGRRRICENDFMMILVRITSVQCWSCDNDVIQMCSPRQERDPCPTYIATSRSLPHLKSEQTHSSTWAVNHDLSLKGEKRSVSRRHTSSCSCMLGKITSIVHVSD